MFFLVNQQQQQKFWPNEPGGRARLFFFLLLIELIEFNSVLTFLKDARERGAHDDCHSPLPGQVGPGLTVSQGPAVCDCAIHTYSHDSRDGRTSHDLDESSKTPSMLAPSQQKDRKKSNKPRKPKENPFGPWPSLPSAVLLRSFSDERLQSTALGRLDSPF